ncbi:hypothetical protein [Streptomyces ipomoeae]|uniref:hypothetical protein n=1 Tax=Streptomyces ipomoeae TaxID=103232 RepID=UPI001146EBE1|nr:hypothetical protein [Streptomyces ipomoeae]TQE35448.1 hypothetical protein Sipo7851_14395 [Streptomyces ipomoeae]
MNVTRAVFARFTGRAPAAALPEPAPAITPPTPAPVAKPEPDRESPAMAAMRLELQQLRLLKAPDGNAQMARLLRESQTARRQLQAQLSALQTANESQARELRETKTRLRIAEDALAVYERGTRP